MAVKHHGEDAEYNARLREASARVREALAERKHHENYRKLYLIGSLRNEKVAQVGRIIRETGIDVFDDWMAAGPEADDKWKEYEQARGRGYVAALKGEAAVNVYNFDKRHLDSATHVALILPAGKSGHLELGYCVGKGKRTAILLEPDTDPRWDVMYQFADAVFETVEQLQEWACTSY